MTTSTLSPRASALLASLSPEQHAAATSTDRVVTMCACPGAGKTRVLVARIVNLLEVRGLPSHSVLAVAFTRAAAREIKRRVIDVVGEELGGLLRAETIHGFALRLLRSVESRRLLPGEFQVATEEEAAEVLLGLFVGSEARPEAKRTSMRKVQQALVRINAFSDVFPFMEEDAATKAVVAIYEARLILRGLATHGQVIREAGYLLCERDPETVAYAEPIAHVLVDEAQDTTRLEQFIVHEIGAAETWIHDPRQSVFGWRHAHGIQYPAEDHSLVPTYHLSRSYRFGSVLASHANEVIPPGQYGPAIEGSEDRSGIVVRAPRSGLVSLVTDAVARHGRLGVAVLARTNWEAAAAATELGPDLATLITRREPVALRAASAIARLSIRGGDEAAFRTLWRLDGGSVLDLHGLLARAGHARSLYGQWLRETTPLNERRMPLLEAASNLPGNAATWRECVTPCAALEGAVDLYRLTEPLFEKSVPDALDALSELSDVDDFARARDHGKVPVATIHSAKGAEWDAVVLLTGGRFPPPSVQSERDREEMRVLFVGVTRAKRELVILEDGGFRP